MRLQINGECTPRTGPKYVRHGTDIAASQSPWVKVCEMATFKTDGKKDKKSVCLCLTHHERLNANTGMVLVPAAIRTTEGQPLVALVAMLPAEHVLVDSHLDLHARYERQP